MARPRIGDERWVLETISGAAVEALARKHGYTGEDLREFVEPEDVAEYTIHSSLEAAIEAANADLARNDSFYGANIIDYQILEAAHDDRGNLVRGCPPSWERQHGYEVASDGEITEVG